MKRSPDRCSRSISSELDLVGAAHVMAKFEQKRGDTAHPAPGHPHQVNPVMLARQELGQIDFRGEHHDCDWVYLSIVSTTRAAAFFGARRGGVLGHS